MLNRGVDLVLNCVDMCWRSWQSDTSEDILKEIKLQDDAGMITLNGHAMSQLIIIQIRKETGSEWKRVMAGSNMLIGRLAEHQDKAESPGRKSGNNNLP